MNSLEQKSIDVKKYESHPRADASMVDFNQKTKNGWKNLGIFSFGIFVGSTFFWLATEKMSVYSDHAKRSKEKILQEVAKNHPDLLKEVAPFIECAALRQPKHVSAFTYFFESDSLMQKFRSDVAQCGKEADLESISIKNKNESPYSLLSPYGLGSVNNFPMPEIGSTPGLAPSSMPALSQIHRPPPAIVEDPLVTVVPDNGVQMENEENGRIVVFPSDQQFLPNVSSSVSNETLIQNEIKIQSPLQVVRPPEK